MNVKILLGKVVNPVRSKASNGVDGKRIFHYVGRALAPKQYLSRMAGNHRKYIQTKGPTKTFQQNGHWIEKTSVTPILLCLCGNRYLKTRQGQTKCLRCLSQGKR